MPTDSTRTLKRQRHVLWYQIQQVITTFWVMLVVVVSPTAWLRELFRNPAKSSTDNMKLTQRSADNKQALTQFMESTHTSYWGALGQTTSQTKIALPLLELATIASSGQRVITNANFTRALEIGGSDYGLKIWGLDNPLSPQLLKVFGKVTTATNSIRAGILGRNEQLFYGADSTRLVIIDWSKPVPQLVASISTEIIADGIALSENEQRAFLFGKDQQNVPTLCTVDLTDLAQAKVERISLPWLYSAIRTPFWSMAYKFNILAKQDHRIVLTHSAWSTQGGNSQNCAIFETTLRIFDASNISSTPINKGQMTWSGCISSYAGVIEETTFGGSPTQVLIAVAAKSSSIDPLATYPDTSTFSNGPKPGVHFIDISNASSLVFQGSSVRVSANSVKYLPDQYLAIASNPLFGAYFFNCQQLSPTQPFPLVAQWRIEGGIRELAVNSDRQLIVSVSGQNLTTYLFRNQLDQLPAPLFTIQSSLKEFSTTSHSNLEVSGNRGALSYGNAVWVQQISINNPTKPTAVGLLGPATYIENSSNNQVLMRKVDQRLLVLSSSSLIEVNITSDTPTKLKVTTWSPTPSTMALSPDEQVLLVADTKPELTLLNATNTSKVLSKFSVFDSVNSIRFTKDGQRIYLGCKQGIVSIDVNGTIISSYPLSNTVGLTLDSNETVLLAGYASDDGREFGLAKLDISKANIELLSKQPIACHAKTIGLNTNEQIAYLGCNNAILVSDLRAANMLYSYPTSNGLQLQYQEASDLVYTNEIEVLATNKKAFKVIPVISGQLQEDNPTLITGEKLTGKFIFFLTPKVDIQAVVKPRMYNISIVEKDGTENPLPSWLLVNQTGEFSAEVPREFGQSVNLRIKLASFWSCDVSLQVIEGSPAPTPTTTPTITTTATISTATATTTTTAVTTQVTTELVTLLPSPAPTSTTPISTLTATQLTPPPTPAPTPFFANSSTIAPSADLTIDNSGPFPQIISTATTVTVQMGAPGQFMLNGPWSGLLAGQGIQQVAMSTLNGIVTLVGPPEYLNAVLAQIRYSPENAPYKAEDTFPMLATQAGISGWVKADPRFNQFKTNLAPQLTNGTFNPGPFARNADMSLSLKPEDHFKDPDGDTYEVVLTKADGSSLPSDIFALENAKNSGAKLKGFSSFSESYNLVYFVKDSGGMQSPQIPLRIVFTNMPPGILMRIPDATLTPGAVSYTVPGPAFAGNNLILSAALSDGSSLLTVGLSFDSRFSMLSGYFPRNGEVSIVFKATTVPSGDFSEQTVVYKFDTPPPTIIAVMQNKTLKSSTGRLSEDLNLYFNGSSLTFSTRVEPPNILPAWLSIDPASGKLFGTPEVTDATCATGFLYIFQLLGITSDKRFLELFGKQQAAVPFAVVATDPTGATASQYVIYHVDLSFENWLSENGTVLLSILSGLITLIGLYKYWPWIPNHFTGIGQGYVDKQSKFVWDPEECVYQLKLPYTFNVQVVSNKQLNLADLDFGTRLFAVFWGCISYNAGSAMLLYPNSESWIKYNDKTNSLIIDPGAITAFSREEVIDVMAISGRVLKRLIMDPQSYRDIELRAEPQLLEKVPEVVTGKNREKRTARQSANMSPAITKPVLVEPATVARPNPLYRKSIFADTVQVASIPDNTEPLKRGVRL